MRILVALATVLLAGTTLPAMAAPAPPTTPATPAVSTAAPAPTTGATAQRECATPEPGQLACFAVRRTDVRHAKGVQRAAAAAPSGYAPADLAAAYDLPTGTAGAGETVAITIAFDNPHLEADLAVYRQQFGLPPCTTANGCLRKIDQRGGTDYPIADERWGGELDLDVDMVSAACPQCRLLVVEADDNSPDNLYAAVDQAVAQGARFVSNSWGGPADPDEARQLDKHFEHPGVAFTVSSGDLGFGLEYPAFSQHVTAVGGTSLRRAANERGWTETAWSGAGAGCAAGEPKPAWQTDAGCPGRMEADVSAVADPYTGVAVYDQGWQVFGGTSVAAPLIAGVYALAGPPATDRPANSYPYANVSALHDVTSGSDGYCPDTPYFCTAGPGYDGPTGLGTPDGTSAFSYGPHGQVTGTVTDAGSRSAVAGATVTVGAQSTTTDAQGRYALSIPLGAASLRVTAFGYQPAERDVAVTTDGQHVSLDLALTPRPRVTVSGTLHDGSGHGWPLAGTVQVDGQPSTQVDTDPATGAYRLSVPAGADYPIVATPAYRGYQPVRRTVSVGDTDQPLDLAATVDPVACNAPGYGVHIDDVLHETFDGSSAPAGWTVNDYTGNGQTWKFGNGVARIDATGISQYEGSAITSPAIDVPAHPVLTFDTVHHDGTAQVFVGGYQAFYSGGDDDGPVTLDLSQVAGTSAGVEFVFSDFGTGSWQVDNVTLGERSCVAQPGGLVVGHVTDANTGAPLGRATVDSTSVSGQLFALFQPAGTRSLTATAADGYQAVTHSVGVSADAVSTLDFALPAGRLSVNPASISGSTALGTTTTATFTVTNTGTAPATFTWHSSANDSAAASNVPRKVGPKAKPTQPHKALRTASVSPASPPWTASADYPVAVTDAAAATAPDGTVYTVGGVTTSGLLRAGWRLDPVAATWTRLPDLPQARYEPRAAFLLGKLYVVGGLDENGAPINSLAVYDPKTGAWTSGAALPHPVSSPGIAVAGGQLYVIGGCPSDLQCGQTDVQVYDPATGAWSAAPDYPVATSWLGCGGISGRVYCAGGVNDSTATGLAAGYAFDPARDAWTRIADLPGNVWGASVSAQGGRLLLSGGVLFGSITNAGFGYDPATDSWATLPNAYEPSYAAAGACGLYRIGGRPDPVDISSTVEVLPGYGSCSGNRGADWLSASPATATLPPGASRTVTVTLDAGAADVPKPGAYLAGLAGAEDTPYPAPQVSVSMTVTPPATWAAVTGTVTGTPCGATSGPLAGVTISAVGGSQQVSTSTDAAGSYTAWLNGSSKSATVYAALDGWAPASKTVKIAKGKKTTLNLQLRPDHRC